jgi:hypothetical protein
MDNEIDLSDFEARFRNEMEGRPGYDPRILMKVVLTDYSRGIIHFSGINSNRRALSFGQSLKWKPL